ncbi:MAG TPA: ergothioneine biosynthesis protein EgtB [Acidimicrobiia bacterium]|nr:ergothioneine biosynthesis protein EgtB [Acidimicrobiia bacterium]
MTVDTESRIEAGLGGARARTLSLLAPIDDADLARQVSPLMSPLIWDLAHVGHYEELWLLRNVTGAAPTNELFDDVYDAFKHPRRDRPSLPILGPDEARAFVGDVRRRVLDALATVDLDGDDPLVRDGFVYGMVVQHEHQHDETMLATIQLMEHFAHPDADDWRPSRVDRDAGGTAAGMVDVRGGVVAIGTDELAWVYDNERPRHGMDVTPFRIDRTPVTNRQYAAFVEDGGYDDERLWSGDGWAWRRETGAGAPEFWRREGDGSWSRRRYGRREDLPSDEPVQHVCWHEADAFACWRGARLPTETEWEAAAALDGTADGPRQMLGEVWEWTATDFHGYPGFVSFPYREYSEVFFGPEYKVLRGGSWATDAGVRRPTFRNWDYPIRRQIFAGFRCADDA